MREPEGCVRRSVSLCDKLHADLVMLARLYLAFARARAIALAA